MNTFLDWVCRKAEKTLDLLVSLFDIIFGPIVFDLFCVLGLSFVGIATCVIIGSLVIGVRKLCEDAQQSLRDQWHTLLASDPNKPRIPVMPPSPPNQAVCDPITDSADPSKDQKKKDSSFEAEQVKKIKQIETELKRKTIRLEHRQRRQHKTNYRLATQHQKTLELKNKEVEDLKSRYNDLIACLRISEESRAQLSQLQATSSDPYDKDLKIPGRIPTMSARLPMPDFCILDVIDRRKAKPTAPFNITFYSMPQTVVLSKASAPVVLSLPSAAKTINQHVENPSEKPVNEYVDQRVNQSVTCPAVVQSSAPSSAPSAVRSLVQSRTKHQTQKLAQLHTRSELKAPVSSPNPVSTSTRSPILSPTQPIAIPPIDSPLRAPQRTESPVANKLVLSCPETPSASLSDSLSQQFAQSPAIPSSLIRPSSPIAAPASPAVAKKDTRKVSQKADCLAKECENDASASDIDRKRDDGNSEKNSNAALPPLPDSDAEAGSDEEDGTSRDDNLPPFPDLDVGSDREDDDEVRNKGPENAGGLVASASQQPLVTNLSDPVPAQASPSVSSPVRIVTGVNVHGPTTTLLGNQMDVDVENENKTREDNVKKHEMEVGIVKINEDDPAKDKMEIDVENNQTNEDDTEKDKMDVDIENENKPKEDGATTDNMQLADPNLVQGAEDVDMADAPQQVQRPMGDDVEMGDGTSTSVAPNTKVFGKHKTQPTTVEQPSTPLPTKSLPQQGTLLPQAPNVFSDENISDKAPPLVSESKDKRPVFIIRRRPADPMVQRKPGRPRPQQPQQPTTPTSQAGNSPTVTVPGPPSLIDGTKSEGTVTLFPMSRKQNSRKPVTPSSTSSVRLFPHRPAGKHKYDEVAAVDEDYDGDADLSMPFDFDGPPRKILPLPKRVLQTFSAADDESRRQRGLEAKRRWLLAQEQEAAAGPELVMEQSRSRPPPSLAMQGVSARDDRLLLSGTTELRRELLHRLQVLWPLLPKAEVDRVRMNNLRSKALAEWRKLLNPAGRHALPENSYISREAFERGADEWMGKVVDLMTKLRVIPEAGTLLETWRECVARQEPLPEPEDNQAQQLTMRSFE